MGSRNAAIYGLIGAIGLILGLIGYMTDLYSSTIATVLMLGIWILGGAIARVVLSGGVGYKPRNKGERKRVVVRGNTVTTETTFLNFKIVEKPKGQKKKKAEPKPEEAQETQE